MNRPLPRLSRVLVTCGFLAFALVRLAAQSVWNGGGADNELATGANWQAGSAPANNGTASLQFAGSTRLAPTFATAWSVAGITFASGAGAFTIGGTTTGSVPALTVSGGITNSSSVSQTFNRNVTVSGSQTWSGQALVFNSAVNVGSGQLTINNATTFNGSISGSSFTKSGSGLLTLGASTTYSGTITLTNGGGMSINGSNALSNATINLQQGTSYNGILYGTSTATIGAITGDGQFSQGSTAVSVGSGSTNSNYSGTLEVGGTLTKVGSSTTLYLGGVVSRNLAITDGIVSLYGSGNTFNSASISIAAPGILEYARGGTVTYTGTTSGAGLMRLNGSAGTLIVTGTLGHSGDTQVSAGVLQIGAGGTLGSISGNLKLNNFASVMFNRSNAMTYGGNITGFGSITKSGAGTLTLTGNNTYDNGTTLAGGTLSIDADTRLGTAPASATTNLTFNGGTLATTATMTLDTNRKLQISAATGTINTATGTTLTYGGIINGNALAKAGAGTLVLGGANNHTGTTLTAGTLSVAANGALGTASGAVTFNGGTLLGTGSFTANRATSLATGGGTIDAASGVTLTWNGNITGSSGNNLTKSGTGILILGGSNSYAGATNVLAGELRMASTTALSSSTVLSIATGSTFDANGFAPTMAGLSGSGTFNLGSAGATIAPTGTQTFAGQITGSGGLAVNGSGTLVLTNTNSFSGNVSITQGTLRLGAAGAVPGTTAVSVAAGGTLDLNSLAAGIGSLQGAGNVSLGSAILTVNQSANSTFSGVLSGTGGLTKTGSGSFELTGANSYSGATVLNGGTLKVTGSAANSSFTVSGGILDGAGTTGALTIASGGTLAPGNSPGTLNSGSATWEGGGTYLWEINNGLGSAGANPGWDLLNITGALNITATSGNRFNIDLTSLTLGNAAGLASNFNASQDHTYLIATASGGITGFSADQFDLDLSDFANDLAGGTWNIAQSGNNLNLVFAASTAAIPEPSTYALLAGLAGLGAAACRRRRPARS